MDTRVHLDRSRTGQRKKRIENIGVSFLNPKVSTPLTFNDYLNNMTTVISPKSGTENDDYGGCTNI